MLVTLTRDYANRKAGDALDLPAADAHFLLSEKVAALAPDPTPPPPAPPAPTFADFLLAVQAHDLKSLGRMGSAFIDPETSTKSALTLPAGGTGGYLVPTHLHAHIMGLPYRLGVVRPHAAVLPMSSAGREVPAMAPRNPAKTAPARFGPDRPPAPYDEGMATLDDADRTAPRLTRRWRASIPDHAAALAWHPSGQRLAAAAVSGPVHVLDAANGQTAHALAGHGFGTVAAAYRPDGAILATLGQDGKARLWADAAETAVLPLGAAWGEALAWHPTDDLLATAAGKVIRLWSAGTLQREHANQPATVSALTWRPGSGELTSAGYGAIRLWKPDADAPAVDLPWKNSVLCMAWHPGGSALAHGDQSATAHLWFPPGEDEHLEMAGYESKVKSVSWERSGRLLATAGGEVILVWDCKPPGPAGTRPIALKGHSGPVNVVAYRGVILASGGEDGKLMLWLPGSLRKASAVSETGAAVSALAWSPNGRMLAVGNAAGGVSVYSV